MGAEGKKFADECKRGGAYESRVGARAPVLRLPGGTLPAQRAASAAAAAHGLERARLRAGAAAALLAGLLVERRALDVARQTFLLAGLLESLEELVETLVHPDFDADQALTSLR